MALSGFSPLARLDVAVDGLRSAKGEIRICVTTRPDRFPGCEDDPDARKASIPVAQAQAIRFDAMPSGNYAIALIHDENGNAKLDTFAGVPREGVGFSRNPRLSFGPPRFAAAQFAIDNRAIEERVRMKYFL